jgi:hypothetical protein
MSPYSDNVNRQIQLFLNYFLIGHKMNTTNNTMRTRNLYTTNGDVTFELKGFKDGVEIFTMDFTNTISFDINNNDIDLETLITINQYLLEYKDGINIFNNYESSDLHKLDQADKLLLLIKVKGFEFYNNPVEFQSHKIAFATNDIAKLTLVFKSI